MPSEVLAAVGRGADPAALAGPIRAELADALARAAAAVDAGDVDAARAWCRCATAVADGWHVALLPRDAAAAWCREVAT